MPISRRRFLAASAATAALPSLRLFGQATAAQPTATLTLRPNDNTSRVPANFIGLSYETQELSTPDFFSAQNTGLITQFRALAPHGVLRLGGNTSDIGWWKPTPSTPRPEIQVRADAGAGEPTAALAYAIEPIAHTNLRAFLDATGWTCLYGINLGTNTPTRAADEAASAARILGWADAGGKLEYFQLGNEPDLFSRHLRDLKTWSADAYFTEWLAQANAIRARVPGARFGLPDTAGRPDWYATIVARLIALPTAGRPSIAAFSHHYYFGGPPSNPDVNIDRMLQSVSGDSGDTRVGKLAIDITAAAEGFRAATGVKVPWRMTEGNTCFRGGKPGVSDVFAAALWAADYALKLAEKGYAGINLHGGDAQFVANSLGGKLPGDELVLAEHGNPDDHPHPYYTPIAHLGPNYVLEPVGCGLKFAQQFAGAHMFPVDFNPGPVNATAYAASRPNGQLIVAIINKDATQPLHIDLAGYSLALSLTAPSLTSRTASLTEPARFREASIVAPASAVLLERSRD